MSLRELGLLYSIEEMSKIKDQLVERLNDFKRRGLPENAFAVFIMAIIPRLKIISRANNPFSLIEFYGKVPVLCLDELGYVIPTKQQVDWIFQIISKRTELVTTIITTNFIPSNWEKIFDL